MDRRIQINEQIYRTCFIVIIHICVSTCLNQTNPPVIYKPSGCVSSGGIWYIIPSLFEECTEACLRQTKCLSVNYNRISTLCILRDTEDEPKHDGFCYHVVLSNLNFTNMPVADPCRERPCSNQSVCESSSYSGEGFTCRVLYCDTDKIPTMPNAQIQSKESTKLNNTNAYVCHSGYTMYGDSRIRCMFDGNWSSVSFTCYKNCPPNLEKTGSTVLRRSQMRLTNNAVVTYACKAGYYTFENPVMTCKADGSWTDFDCLPYCTQKDIPTIKNGAPMMGTVYTINDKARYTCNAGHYLSTSADTIACRIDGTWEVPTVECWTYCTQKDIPPIQNGAPITGTFYTISDKARYTCNAGNYLSSSTDTIACHTDGIWEVPTVECWTYCSQPTGNPAHSILMTKTQPLYTKGMTVTFVCSPSSQFYPDTSRTVATCTADGTWAGLSFNCNTYCGEPPIYKGLDDSVEYVEVESGGGLGQYTTANIVTYTCLLWGNLDGNNQKHCKSDGTWSGPIKCCFQALFTCCTDNDCYSDWSGK